MPGVIVGRTTSFTNTSAGWVYEDRRAEIWNAAAPMIRRDITELAPGFRRVVQQAIDECNALGLDVVINEARRIDKLQRLYFLAGRDPAGNVVNRAHVLTGARSAMFGWHFFCLAIDIKHRKLGYQYPRHWVDMVAAVFEKHGIDWGGRWQRPDIPHYQHDNLKPSPSDRARELYFNVPTPQWYGMHPFPLGGDEDRAGLERVWQAVGAAA